MDVVAEGIEEKEQLDILKSLHCNFGQGYFWSKPVEASAARDLLRSQTSQLRQGKPYLLVS